MDLDVDLNDAIPLEPDPIADAALEHTQQLATRPATNGPIDIPERGGIGRYEEMSWQLSQADQRAAQQDHSYRTLDDRFTNALVEIESLRSQLSVRPVVAATDEQLMDVVGMMNAAARSMDAVVMLRSWLSTLGVRRVKQVEAWVAGDRPPESGELYRLHGLVGCWRGQFNADSQARVLERRTLNVLEPNNK